jgi:hypothetical protein
MLYIIDNINNYHLTYGIDIYFFLYTTQNFIIIIIYYYILLFLCWNDGAK